MEIRDFALGIVEGTSLAAKLSPPPDALTDERPGPALRLPAPGRRAGLTIRPRGTVRVPRQEGMADLAQRVRILHGHANHELQAVELFAWALLAFPEAPSAFRRGLVRILGDEQRHLRMYIDRMADLGTAFGDFAVSGYFWGKIDQLVSPRAFVCVMGLTFENANLDHTIDYAEAARAAGDEPTARLLDRVHADEVGHVRFALQWLDVFRRPGQARVEAYLEGLRWPLRPVLGRGRRLHTACREAAGFDPELVALFAGAGARR